MTSADTVSYGLHDASPCERHLHRGVNPPSLNANWVWGGMATIHDVAERAGVSPKTVSRVLNDHESVSAKTRDRVRAAMQDLGYQPSAVARSLRSQDLGSVGVLMGDPSGGYHTRVHHALLLACVETGRHLSVDLSEGPVAGWQDRIRAFVTDSGIREMILLPPECDFGPLKALMRELDVRCVLITPTSPDPCFPAIGMDDRAAAREVVEHLFAWATRGSATSPATPTTPPAPIAATASSRPTPRAACRARPRADRPGRVHLQDRPRGRQALAGHRRSADRHLRRQ
jgi:transcriptional regulator with XRE-family HTH domain